MIRKCSLMFSLIALTTFLSVQNPHAKPVGNRFTTSVTSLQTSLERKMSAMKY